jgi:hypothetical protein
MTEEQNRSRREHLTSTTNKGEIELSEQELNRVAGGMYDAFLKYDGQIASEPRSPLPTVACCAGQH